MTIVPFNWTKGHFLEFNIIIHDDSDLYNILIIIILPANLVFWH